MKWLKPDYLPMFINSHTPQKTLGIQTQTIQSLPEPIQHVAQSLMKSGMGTLFLGLLLLIIGMNLFSARKGKISTGRFGGRTERWAAAAIARQQRRGNKPNKVALRAGNIDLPQAQQSIIVSGAPDSGKTFSIIDRAIQDAICQGFPIVVYDFKGSQLEAHAAYAAAQGYQVDVFAPGQSYTGICNPLDFLADESDSLMASQLAEVIQKNAQRNGGSSYENDFFAAAGAFLVEAVMLLAKTTPYPDLFMANKILNLENLPARIRLAQMEGRIPAWTLESFSQLISSEGADKQVAGIIATAQKTFKKFIGKQLVSSFCGNTSIALDLTGKRILFLQVDIQKRDAVSPLLAAVLHMLVLRNFAKPRTETLVVALDELPTLYLADLYKWVNEFRSYGFVSLLGYQNFAQLQHIYGREVSQALFAACGTKIFFNPKHRETANEFSGYLGDKEVRLFTNSRSSGMQRSTSRNEQYQKVPLMTPDQILKLDQGECILINPAYKGGGEAFIPMRVKVRVPQREIRIEQRSIQLWNTMVRDRLIQRATQLHLLDQDPAKENERRRDLAEKLFPLPKDSKNIASGQSHDTESDISEDEYDEIFQYR